MARIGSKVKAMPQAGALKDGQGLESVAAYSKTIVLELTGAESNAAAYNDILYQFPCDAVVKSVIVKNSGTTALSLIHI